MARQILQGTVQEYIDADGNVRLTRILQTGQVGDAIQHQPLSDPNPVLTTTFSAGGGTPNTIQLSAAYNANTTARNASLGNDTPRLAVPPAENAQWAPIPTHVGGVQRGLSNETYTVLEPVFSVSSNQDMPTSVTMFLRDANDPAGSMGVTVQRRFGSLGVVGDWFLIGGGTAPMNLVGQTNKDGIAFPYVIDFPANMDPAANFPCILHIRVTTGQVNSLVAPYQLLDWVVNYI